MKASLSAQTLSCLSQVLAERTGLHFPRERWADLESGVVAAARGSGIADAEACAQMYLSAPLTRTQIEVLASHLTVGETYFFRERNSFDALEAHILPELLRARRGAGRRLRIWSAGCCTGEEPFSIAMLLDRLVPDIDTWKITILATDINPQFLKKAAEGVYGEWSFRNTSQWIRDRYFTKRRDGRFELNPAIRKRVTFSHLNLAEDAYPSLANNTNAMDVILCRNVLMYFTPERITRAAAGFSHALVEGGWLIVSPAETSNATFSALAAVEFPGAVLYRKADGATPAVGGRQPRSAGMPFEPERPTPQVAQSILPAQVQPRPPDRTPTAASSDAIAQAPAGPDSFTCSARACANAGRLDEAIGWCEKAIAADKLNPAHYYLFATVRHEQGQLDMAATLLTRALYLDADFVLAHFALGNVRLSQGRSREAERHFANVLAVLRPRAPDEILPEADGLTAGRLAEITASVLASQPRPVA